MGGGLGCVRSHVDEEGSLLDSALRRDDDDDAGGGAGYFDFVTIRDAGHMVPRYKPAAALETLLLPQPLSDSTAAERSTCATACHPSMPPPSYCCTRRAS